MDKGTEGLTVRTGLPADISAKDFASLCEVVSFPYKANTSAISTSQLALISLWTITNYSADVVNKHTQTN